MELALSAIQKLRHDHRALGDRLEEVSNWLGRAAAKPPTAPAWLAACRVVVELAERMPDHLHEENCVRCPNYTPCHTGAGCSGGDHAPKEHEGHLQRDELGEAVRGLAELVARAGSKPDEAAWRAMAAGLLKMRERFHAHVEAEEKSFKKTVLDQGRTKR
jgi:iron-sulfur cluster repair protein YtfE (RIC family)